MSVLARLFPERRTANLGYTDEVLAALSERRLVSTWSGAPVTFTTALRHIAVWSSTNFIADLISALPWHTYRDVNNRPSKDPDGNRLIANPDPGYVTPIGWRRQVLISLLMRGNGLGLVLAHDEKLFPTQIRMTHPDDWQVSRVGKLEQPQWKYQNNEIKPAEMWRVTGYETPGSPIGMSPISYIAQTIGLGLSAQRFGAQWFDEGAVPASLLINDNKIDEPIALEAKRRWKEAGSSREVRTLGNGWKYHQIQIAANESQFLETIQANGAMVATMFGLRPEDIGFKSGDSMTYANVEQRQIARLTYPIHGWVRRLEDALSSAMPKPQYARANVDALIRVDLATRYKGHDTAIRGGWRSVNETRELEEQPPIAGGDQYLWPPGAKTTEPEPTSNQGSN